MGKNWYATGSINNHDQALIIEEDTGRNVAVAYNMKDAPLLAASPKLRFVLESILKAHESGNNGAYMGEAVLCEYFASMARSVIAEAKEGEQP